MGRWLSKTERAKRDADMLRLHNEGYSVSQIAARFKNLWPGQIYKRLKLLGVKQDELQTP